MKIGKITISLASIVLIGSLSAREVKKEEVHHVKKHEPMHEATKTSHHHEAAAKRLSEIPAAPRKSTEHESMATTANRWLNRATETSAAAHMAAGSTVHHRGPEGFFERHNFPGGWEGGFVGRSSGNQWIFAGYPLEWWQQNYPTYYRDVVRPEYTKAGGK